MNIILTCSPGLKRQLRLKPCSLLINYEKKKKKQYEIVVYRWQVGKKGKEKDNVVYYLDEGAFP